MDNKILMDLLLTGVKESLMMTVLSTVFAYILGLPLGILLVVTEKQSLLPIPKFNAILNFIVNIMRSIPFLILMIAIIPLTRWIAGTTIGSGAAVVPLVVSAFPLVGRMVEGSLKEVEHGVVEAAVSMGASNFQIIHRVLIGEALPSLINGASIALTTILGYSAMAGTIGGGGLGALAINYGYHRYQTTIMFITIVLLVIIVQLFQLLGEKIARLIDKRRI